MADWVLDDTAGLEAIALGRYPTRKRIAVELHGASIHIPPSSAYVEMSSTQPSRKRKRNHYSALSDDYAIASQPFTKAKKVPELNNNHNGSIDPASENEVEQRQAAKGRSRGKNLIQNQEEKRLKRFRTKMPQSFEVIMQRAITQRMFIVDRKRHFNDNCPHSTPDCPIEVIDLAGTTGNIYTVTVEHVPSCTCPNFIKGNSQCKHILYVLIKVLKAPEHIMYQTAFLTSELREIFENAGPLPSNTITAEDKDGKRKPVEGDCPICVEELNTETEDIVWCHAACGNNLHKMCFDQWAASKRGSKVTCPYCRTQWETTADQDVLKKVSKDASVNEEGYVNIADHLGISRQRDYSTCHRFWVRGEQRAGRMNT